MKQNLSKTEIRILLEIVAYRFSTEEAQKKIAKISLARLLILNLVKETGRGYPWCLTERGHVYVHSLCNVELPVKQSVIRWVTPK